MLLIPRPRQKPKASRRMSGRNENRPRVKKTEFSENAQKLPHSSGNSINTHETVSTQFAIRKQCDSAVPLVSDARTTQKNTGFLPFRYLNKGCGAAQIRADLMPPTGLLSDPASVHDSPPAAQSSSFAKKGVTRVGDHGDQRSRRPWYRRLHTEKPAQSCRNRHNSQFCHISDRSPPYCRLLLP